MNTKINNLRKDERAVSPLIAVILMVAITVIMAAIIGAFIYGYGGTMVYTKDVAATARHQGDEIIVTFMGGPDQGLVETMHANINGTVMTLAPFVGTFVRTSALVTEGVNNHVVVVANFTDGSAGVVLDTFC